MTPEEFAKLDPTSPGYGEAEQEMFRQQQEKHVKSTEHDAATKLLHETAPAGMFAAHVEAEREEKAKEGGEVAERGRFNRLDKDTREPEPE